MVVGVTTTAKLAEKHFQTEEEGLHSTRHDHEGTTRETTAKGSQP